MRRLSRRTAYICKAILSRRAAYACKAILSRRTAYICKAIPAGCASSDAGQIEGTPST